tara:strand:- start:22530 stop:22904 length:375 start_codon:yes stop_codon:yes gene_type:complete
MKLENIYLQPNSPFSAHISEWAGKIGIQAVDHTFKVGDQVVDGLLLINENQDIDKEINTIHSYFDERHLPTQKIDVNGTLQVAISNFDMWFHNFKCKNILILGSDELVKNTNLDRFLTKIEGKI